MPFHPFLGEGSPTKIDYRKTVGTLIRTSLLEDLAIRFLSPTAPLSPPGLPAVSGGLSGTRRARTAW